MKIVLVNPPNGFNDATYLTPPLGLLTLASFVRQFDYEVDIVDLNLEMFADKTIDNDDFYQKSCEIILKKKPDVVGFTSMCLESHVSLEIVKNLKEKNPNIKTIFGGTHFGAIANELLENFDFVDFVISGEGEDALLSILNKLEAKEFALTENVTYWQNGKIQKGILETKIFPLEEIPFPAYDLVDLKRYFELNPAHLFNYEAGRGCVFKCAFCYSPFHYGNNVRHKSPEAVVKELKKLIDLGAKHIFFVQDNFLNSPRWASEVCREIAKANLPLTWECYSTYPQLKEQIVDLLAEAKCKGVFTGIDAVSISSQKRMNKPFLKDWETTSEKLSYCLKKGIRPMCAFILEEPNQDIEKIESTIYTALECIRLGCEVHLNTLSLYNNTELARKLVALEYYYSDIKPDLLLDTPKIVQRNVFAEKLPQLFPYHSTYCEVKEWEVFTAKAHLIFPLVQGLTNTLYQFVVNERKSVWQTLSFIDTDFVKWLRNLKPTERHEAVIFKFAESFIKQDLSPQTKTLFQRELATIFLGNRKNERFVNLISKGAKLQAKLAWFVNLQKFDNIAEIEETVNQTVAFLSEERTIKFYSVPFQLWKVLENLESAVNSKQTKTIDLIETDILLENNWIFLVNNTQDIR